eukprot:1159416-Pelagomonas_calceolata.AAC.16
MPVWPSPSKVAFNIVVQCASISTYASGKMYDLSLLLSLMLQETYPLNKKEAALQLFAIRANSSTSLSGSYNCNKHVPVSKILVLRL